MKHRMRKRTLGEAFFHKLDKEIQESEHWKELGDKWRRRSARARAASELGAGRPNRPLRAHVQEGELRALLLLVLF